MKVKTSELIDAALDWAVAKCEGVNAEAFHLYYEPTEPTDYDGHGYPEFHYSSIWAQGGPIIERVGIGFFCNRTAAVGSRFAPDAGADWRAFAFNKHAEHHFGPTPLIAAMRCYVASKLGDEVEVPGELL